MKYAMLVYSDQSAWEALSEEEAARLRAESMPRWIALFEEMGKADPSVQGRELAGGVEAKVVRVVDGETIVTDGPFAETKEQLGGVFVTELPDLDEAIRLAALVPAAEYGTLEIRPLVDPVNERLAAVYAEEWPRCVAILTRVLGDLERAEDAVQDAFATALERWPRHGRPGQPRRLDRHRRPQPGHRPDPA